MTAFGLAHPWVLLGLLLLPLYALRRARLARRDRVPFPPLQYGFPAPGPRRLARLAPAVELALVGLCLVALAGPYRESELDLVDDPGIDLVLVLDVSLSMLAEDFPPNRLAALTRLAGDFLERGGGHRVGLVIFAGDAFVQSPLTTDRATLHQLLDGVSVHSLDQRRSGGTAIGDALLVAGERLLAARRPGRDQAVVLITDGDSNRGIDPVLAGRWLAEREVRLHAIGIGGDEPVPVTFLGEPVGEPGRPHLAALDEASLRAVADAAGGSFQRAGDVGVLEAVLAELSRLESSPLVVRQVRRRHGLAGWLAPAALALFSLHLLLAGVVLRRPLR